MLAQQLQFVLQRSALEAGMFLLPLMIGSAVGGPLAGGILQFAGLRLVASMSLFVAAASLAGIGYSDLSEAGWEVDLLLVALGLSLGIGLTASSVAIMGSTPVAKAGAAGALEATSYDLGTGLGITGFGLLLATSYQRAIVLPGDLPAATVTLASQSIGETLMVAGTMSAPVAQAVAQAGRLALSASYGMVMLSAAALVGLLGIGVLVALRHDLESTADSPPLQ